MNILYVAWTDMGDINWKRAQAINKYTNSKATCIAVKGHSDYGEFKVSAENVAQDEQKAMDDIQNILEKVLPEMDIVHQTNTHPWMFGLDDFKNFVCEFSGGYVRMYSTALWRWQLDKKKPIICPPVLGRYLVRFHFIPIPLDTDEIKPRDDWLEFKLPIKVRQTASRRDYKDSDLFEEACKELPNIEPMVAENVPYDVSLQVKRDADVYFGSFKIGSPGMSQREAMAYGCALIQRMQPFEMAYNPGFPALSPNNVLELREMLIKLSKEPDFLIRKKKECREYAIKRYHPKVIADTMDNFYKYVIYDDDPYWWKAAVDIWAESAVKEQGISQFINPQALRW